MTISSSTNKIIGSGNGVTTSWPFSFKVFDPDHLVVTHTDAGGDETTLDVGAYTVNLNADQDASPGGTVTCSPAIATGTKLTILRTVPYTQAIDLKNQGGFFPEVLERGFDLVVMQVQQLREQLARALKLSPSQAAIGELEATDASRPNTFIGFGPTGLLTLFSGVASTAVSLAMQPVIAAASLATARTAMGVPGLGANTYTGAQTLPGNAGNALEAVPKQQVESIAATAASAVVEITGSVKMYVGASAPSGWLALAGDTLGGTLSGATARANADTQTLFALLWNDTTNTELVIQNSSGAPTTRGASAAADFAANKRMPLPDFRDYFPRGRSGSRANLSTQQDAMQGHRHQLNKDALTDFLPTTNALGFNDGIPGFNSAGTPGNVLYVGDPRADGVNGTPRTANETRPKNIALMFIVKL